MALYASETPLCQSDVAVDDFEIARDVARGRGLLGALGAGHRILELVIAGDLALVLARDIGARRAVRRRHGWRSPRPGHRFCITTEHEAVRSAPAGQLRPPRDLRW
eukprot:1983390-Rhodomonas_salina.3